MDIFKFLKNDFFSEITNCISIFILLNISLLLFSKDCFSQYVDNDYSKELGFTPKFFKPTQDENSDYKINTKLPSLIKGQFQTLAKGQKSLLGYMPYIGPERHQQSCGNCWAWASTGAMEIELSAFKNIYDRLSVQYINSVLFSDFSRINACNGGATSYFTSVYSKKSKLIPWSNVNADFKDGNGGKFCKDDNNQSYWCPNVSTDEIQDIPNYPITSLGLIRVNNLNDTTQETVQKIKHYINNNFPVVMEFCFTAANNFTKFWLDGNEDDVWDMSYISPNAPSNSTYSSDCHAVLITGYNDLSDNDDENYLEILNSWGTPSNRPNGIFKTKLNMNYGLKFKTGNGYSYKLINGLFVINPNFIVHEGQNTGTVIINAKDYLDNPMDMTIYFNNETYYTDTNGQILIPNVLDNQEYVIEHYYSTQSTQYDKNSNQCLVYQFDNQKFSGTFDFSVNNTAEFIFTKNFVKSFSPQDITGKIYFTFKDSKGNDLKNVSIHLNNETYQTSTNSNKYDFSGVYKNTNYNFSFSKNGYIFDNFQYYLTGDELLSQCNSWMSERTIIGREITENKAIIHVVDEDNNLLQNEIIVFNNKEYTTNNEGIIILENLSDGESYDIKAKTEKGGTTINDTIYCYNYDHLSGTFDFSTNNTINFTITKHISNLYEQGTYRIYTYYSHEFSNVRFSNVPVNVNGVLYQTDQYGILDLHNLAYGTNLTININVDGYYPIVAERKFNYPNYSNLRESNCNSFILGTTFNLISTDYPEPTPTFTITPTKTRTLTRTNTPTKTMTFTRTATPTKTFTNTPNNINSPTIAMTPTKIHTPTPTKASTATNTNIPTSTFTPTSLPISYGRIVVNIRGDVFENVEVIYNKQKTYKTIFDGSAYIPDVPINKTFTLDFKLDGYKFSPSTYEGQITKEDESLVVIINATKNNSLSNCNNVKVNTKKIKTNATKIYNLSNIGANKETVKNYYSKIIDLLKKIPSNMTICENANGKKVTSYKKIKTQLKASLKAMYQETLKINKAYKATNKKTKKWLQSRTEKLNNFLSVANNEIVNIPEKSYKK